MMLSTEIIDLMSLDICQFYQVVALTEDIYPELSSKDIFKLVREISLALVEAGLANFNDFIQVQNENYTPYPDFNTLKLETFFNQNKNIKTLLSIENSQVGYGLGATLLTPKVLFLQPISQFKSLEEILVEEEKQINYLRKDPLFAEIVDLTNKTASRTPFKVFKNLEGKLHRDDGPAVKTAEGTEEYWLNGKLHRDDGPAVTTAEGTEEYWLNGKLHRDDGPAVITASGTEEYWLNGKLHRDDGPAVTTAEGLKQYWVDGYQIQ